MSDRPRMPASYDEDISREPDNSESTLEHARQLGAEHGRNAAGWAFDGNTDAETYRRTLAGLDEIDPLILNDLDERIPRLGDDSDYSEADLAKDLDVESPSPADHDVQATQGFIDECADAYHDAAGEAFYAEVERIARVHVQPHGLDMASAYVVAGSPGVAWRIVSSDAVDGMVTAVMIGDDREEAIDAGDLTPIKDEDYCGGCGQTGHNFC